MNWTGTVSIKSLSSFHFVVEHNAEEGFRIGPNSLTKREEKIVLACYHFLGERRVRNREKEKKKKKEPQRERRDGGGNEKKGEKRRGRGGGWMQTCQCTWASAV